MSNVQKEGEPAVTRNHIFDMQVCVPKSFSDNDVVVFANKENPSGTQNGWLIKKQGEETLSGCDERVQCSEHKSHCHIMLSC